MKVNIFRRMVKGRGTMRSMKSVISDTSSRKTCEEDCQRGMFDRPQLSGVIYATGIMVVLISLGIKV